MVGKQHPALRRLRALGRDPALRRALGLFVAEGTHLVREALDAGAAIDLVLGSSRLVATEEGRALRAALARAGSPYLDATDEALDAAQDARSPQPVVALVHACPVSLPAALDPASLVVLACAVQDPGNLGSIRRTAHAAGADLLLLGDGSADPYHPRAVRGSAGAVFRLPAARAPLDELVRALEAREFRLLGADPRGDVSYLDARWSGRVALVLGSEGAGLAPEVAPHLEARLRVPMRTGVESLSIGAAAAVLLFEARKARGAGSA